MAFSEQLVAEPRSICYLASVGGINEIPNRTVDHSNPTECQSGINRLGNFFSRDIDNHRDNGDLE